MESAERLSSIAEAALGLVLAATPVALWIAWTETVLLSVMAVAVISGALLVLLTDFSRRPAEGTRAAGGVERTAVLPDEFVDEVHRLFPLTYHHSLVEKARFRRAMERLSSLIGIERR
jgi:hypothetical protein